MTELQAIITILVAVAATVLTRCAAFVVFNEKRPLPLFVSYLGKVLPGAVFALLVVYCLKGVNITTYPFGIPELIAVLSVVGVHLWKRNMLISVSVGTIVFMVLVQVVFA